MSQLPIHTVESAPQQAKPALEQASGKFGFIPNLIGKLANAPAALEAYLAISAAFERSSLSAVERQVVLLTTSVVNQCPYCVAVHSLVASRSGADASVIEALRGGRELSDERLEALRRHTNHLARRRGQAEPGETQRFLSAGFQTAQIYEVITGIAQKTLSNYADHVELVPVDEPFKAHTWTAPQAVVS